MKRTTTTLTTAFALALASLTLLVALVAATANASTFAPAKIFTIAGIPRDHCPLSGACGDGGAAIDAHLNNPEDVAVAPDGAVLVAETNENAIRRIDPATGTITTVAGGNDCVAASCGDGGPAVKAALYAPSGLDVDARGDLFIADTNDDVIRRVDHVTGTITTVAGTLGTLCAAAPCGDGGPATRARLSYPRDVAVDAVGDLFIADTYNNAIRRVDHATGVITTVAGVQATACGAAPCGDGGAATAATLNAPSGVTVTAAGDLLIADTGDHAIRRVGRGTGIITTVAGTIGTACAAAPCGDGGAAGAAKLRSPESVILDAAGDLLIADRQDDAIRRVDARTGTITTVGGTIRTFCVLAPCGDGGPATSATLDVPMGVAVDGDGDLLIADTADHAIRVVTAPAPPAGPSGPAGTPGPASPSGAPGPAGPAGAAGAAAPAPGALVLKTYNSLVTRAGVALSYVLNQDATLTLAVTAPHSRKAVTITTVRRSAGIGRLTWNGKLRGRRAPAGRYTVALTAKAGARQATAKTAITLRKQR